jgi:hypothetical protein
MKKSLCNLNQNENFIISNLEHWNKSIFKRKQYEGQFLEEKIFTPHFLIAIIQFNDTLHQNSHTSNLSFKFFYEGYNL